MNLYRTGESGLVAVQPLDPAESKGLAGALVRGAGAPLGDEDLLFVTTDVDDGVATALALDAAGDVVVLGTADRRIDADTVTRALQRVSATADSDYDALEAGFEGGETLREAHAEYFDRDPLPQEAFNGDQRVRLVAPAFDDDALDLAAFLSDRDVAVDAVRVEAFGDPESRSYLVRFVAVDGDATPGEGERTSDEPTSGESTSDDSQQWVAGASAAAASDAATQDGESEEPSEADGSTASGGHESALTTSGGSEAETTGDAATASDAETPDDVEDVSETESQGETETAADTETASDDAEPADDERDESLELPVLLNAVAEGLGERLVGTFDEATDDLLSVERGTELLARPDHPAYAGGVLRYRLRAESDGSVEFAVSIYGGSEAEKEQMRAVVRQNEEPIEAELGYDVAEGYDGFSSNREFARFDQVAAAEIVDEFDRLVRFFHPRVMRA